MSLDRKDIRAKLDPDLHQALTVLCEIDDCDICEFVEREIVRAVLKRVHGATVLAERTRSLGLTGKTGESIPDRVKT